MDIIVLLQQAVSNHASDIFVVAARSGHASFNSSYK